MCMQVKNLSAYGELVIEVSEIAFSYLQQKSHAKNPLYTCMCSMVWLYYSGSIIGHTNLHCNSASGGYSMVDFS